MAPSRPIGSGERWRQAEAGLEAASAYERQDDEARIRRLLVSIEWDPLERPNGLLPWEAKNPEPFIKARGSRETTVVELRGIEPLTSSMPCTRRTV